MSCRFVKVLYPHRSIDLDDGDYLDSDGELAISQVKYHFLGIEINKYVSIHTFKYKLYIVFTP